MPLRVDELFLIPGGAKRYSGDYSLRSASSELAPRDLTQFAGPTALYPLGDIDGDGFADTQLELSRLLSDGSLDFQPFIKYGGRLTTVIH